MATPVAVYASHQFTDVPDSNVFHNSIDWMKDNGITVGCNPPANTQYCPDDDVTRGQMAAFMKRLSESQVVDAASAVSADNADMLDGKSSNAFMEKSVYDSNQDGIVDLLPRAAFNSTTNAPNGADFTLSTEITAPAPGILLISGGVEALTVSASNTYGCFLEIDNAAVPGAFRVSRLSAPADFNNDEDCSSTGAAMVAAGPHTVDFEVEGVAATTSLADVSVWALWVPLDGIGAIPTSITQLGHTSPNIDGRPTN